MANEAEIAGRSKLIAEAMYQANGTLAGVLRGLEAADKTIATHLSDLQKLAQSAGSVQAEESQSEWYGQVARTTGDHEHMEQWNDADIRVRREFGKSQVAAGELSSEIGAGQRGLAQLGDDLDLSQGRLKGALAHLEQLNKLPEFAGSDQSAGLRAQIEHLQQATAQADTGITSTIESLNTARRAAVAFESSGVEPGQFRHTQAVQAVSELTAAEVRQARSTLQSTGTAIYEGRVDAGKAAQFGIDVYNTNLANQQAADGAQAATSDSGTQIDPELARSMDAGTTPGPAAGTGEPPKPVDPRVDHTTPARTHETAGQREDRSSNER